jgi:uncharacterized protein
LYRPDSVPPFPAVVMAHGTSATIQMAADRYAEVFRQAGLAVLLYDHRNFGISGGEPRQQINPWIQARGYRDAVTCLSQRDDIASDRIALWGDSYSAMEVIVVGALDNRISAVIAQCPACGAEKPESEPSGSVFEQMKAIFEGGDVSPTSETTTGPMPVVSFDQMGTPSLLKPIQAFRWFIEYGGRHGSNWENIVTRVVPPTPVPFNPYLAAPYVRADLLMMVAPEDEMVHCNPEMARATYDLVPGSKEYVEIEGGHFGLIYYPSDLFDKASGIQRNFLVERLIAPAPIPV